MAKTKITGIETINFPSTNEMSIMTTSTCCKYINRLLSGIFADYKGCRIVIDQSGNSMDPQANLSMNHPVQLELFFAVTKTDDMSGRIKAFKLINEEKIEKKQSASKMNYVSIVTAYNAAMRENKCTEITQDAVDILSDLLWYELRSNMPEDCTVKNFNERGIALETVQSADTNIYTGQNSPKIIYGVVKYVDINSIFAMLFNKEDDGNMYYEVRPIKPIIPAMVGGYNTAAFGDQKWLLAVDRISEKTMKDLLTELGTVPVTGPNINTEGM